MNYKLKPQKDGTYKIDALIKRNGKQYRQRLTFSGSVRQANLKGAEIVRELEARAERESLTGYLKHFDECIQFYRSRNEVGNGDVSYFNRLSSELGTLSIEDVPLGLQRFIDYLSRTPTRKGTPYKAGTKNRYQQWVRAILNFAAEWDRIDKSPLKRIHKFKEIPRDEGLTSEEIRSLLSAIDTYRPYLRPITVFALQIPSRVTNLRDAKRIDCDLNAQQLRVRNGTTKNDFGISLPIPPNMLKYCQEIPSECPWVFYREENGTYHKLKNFNKAWRFVCEKAGLGNIRFHDLRHCSATELVNAGLSERQLMEIAGWKTNMLSTYYHRNSSGATKAVQNILRKSDRVPNDEEKGNNNGEVA